MGKRVWLLLLIAALICAGAGGYILYDYQQGNRQTDAQMDELRDMRDAGETQAATSDPTAESTVTAASTSTPRTTAEATATAVPTAAPQVTEASGANTAQPTGEPIAVSTPEAAEETVMTPVSAPTDEAPAAATDVTAQTEQPTAAVTDAPTELSAPQAAEAPVLQTTETQQATPVPDAVPTERPWEMREVYTFSEADILPEYRELYALNHDLIGWLTIDGTKIDYPVVQSEDPDFYLRHDFYGNSSYSGMLIVTPGTDVLTPEPMFIIHGHNMRSGTMFADIMKYTGESFCREHSELKFDTLTEKRTYRVVAAFYSRIYEEDEPGFRYNAIVRDEEVMKYFVHGVRESALYDTGEDFDIYDEYMVLSTCAYHAKNGRFVVVAKRVYD